MATGLDLSAILSQAAEAKGDNWRNTAAMQSNASERAGIEDVSSSLFTALGLNTQIIDATKQNADLETQKATVAAGNAFGTNLKVQGEVVTGLAKDLFQQQTARTAALRDIQEKRNVGFFDDPVNWIINQFTINDDIQKHNAANAGVQNAEGQIAQLNTLTQTTARTQNELKESVTAASIDASSASIAQAAAIKANDARVRGLTYNAEGIKAAMQASAQDLNTAFSVFGAQKSEQTIQLALEHMALAREEFDWKKEERKAGKDSDQYLADMITRGAQIRLGDQAEVIDAQSPKGKNIISLMKGNSPLAQQYMRDYLSGVNSTQSGTKILAPTPAQALEVLKTSPVRVSSAQQPVMDILDAALFNAQQAAKTGTLDLKDKNAVTQSINNKSQEIANNMAARVNIGDKSNVYNIPSIQTILSNVPSAAAEPVSQKLLLPLLKAGTDLSDPNTVFAAAVKGIKDGTISYKEFLGLSTVYSAGARLNLEARQLPFVGLVPKFSYNVPLEIGSMGGKEVVDLTKPDLLGRAANKQLSSEINPFTAPTSFGIYN